MSHKHLMLKLSKDTNIFTENAGIYFNRISLFDNNALYNLLLSSCHYAECSIFAVVKHEFFPESVGFSVAIITGENHVIMHTEPKNNIIYLDYFSWIKKPNFDKFKEFFEKVGFIIEDEKILER